MKPFVVSIHIAIALALITLILLQSSQGGLGSAFGGGELYRTKRGAERIVFIATIVAAAVFLLSSIATFLMG
ncbi:preprotein translocase subunit SecG [Candidatus Gottesmanbacteria bacterium]|nr:preprotein translocase subunit SecG [Candidatus Gottesmanbacteria bacterium]